MNGIKLIGLGSAVLVAGLAAVVTLGHWNTEGDIEAFQAQVAEIGTKTSKLALAPEALGDLPAPVQRYFKFVFPKGLPKGDVVRLAAEGQFRRPLTEDFNFTTAEQVIALREPALMFSATTPILPFVWARAYDYFAKGEMEMKAKIMSVLTVVDERETPKLNVISLRRWLLESALFPQGLLPGGPVRWEAIDDVCARAVVQADGLTASMKACFDDMGRMTHMIADEDGDLTTPYHGSGEHVTRSDYRSVDGVMIPHKFVISRFAEGKVHPFFDASLTAIAFE